MSLGSGTGVGIMPYGIAQTIHGAAQYLRYEPAPWQPLEAPPSPYGPARTFQGTPGATFGAVEGAASDTTDALSGLTEVTDQASQAMAIIPGMSVEQANAMDQANASAKVFTATFNAGSGSVQHSVTMFSTLTEAATGNSVAVQQRAAAAQQDWTNATLQATALIKGEMAGAFGNIPTGLTYTQIMAGTQGTSTGTSVGPGNYYGIPVVSPLTPGTLYGHAGGGVISEPSYLVSMRSGRLWGSVAEQGAETVIPHNGGANVSITVYAGMGAGDVLQDASFWRQAWRNQIHPAAQEMGARL